MIRAILDTNVFVSALNYGGTPNAVLKLFEAESFVLCISPSIYRRDPPGSPVAVRLVSRRYRRRARSLLSLAEIIEPVSHVSISRDRNDDHVLAAACDADADVIVTGDDDLLSLGEYEHVKIVTPRSFVDLIERR